VSRRASFQAASEPPRMGAAESIASRVTVGWEEAERETPEGFEVLYPPPPLDADALRRLAESAIRLEPEIAPFGAPRSLAL
jgi:hypothetical protein